MVEEARAEAMLPEARHDVQVKVTRRAVVEGGPGVDDGGGERLGAVEHQPGVTGQLEVATVVEAGKLGRAGLAEVLGPGGGAQGVVAYGGEGLQVGLRAIVGPQGELEWGVVAVAALPL